MTFYVRSRFICKVKSLERYGLFSFELDLELEVLNYW